MSAARSLRTAAVRPPWMARPGGLAARVVAVVLVAQAVVGCGGNALLKGARLDLDRGESERAYAALAAEAREHPDHVDTQVLFAEAALETGRLDDVASALDRVAKKDAEAAEKARRTLWRASFRPVLAVLDTLDRATDDDLARAREALTDGDRIRAGTPAATAAAATFALREGDVDAADAGFRAAIRAARAELEDGGTPSSPGGMVQALARGAELHARAGRTDAAVALGRAAAEIAPDDVRAGYDLGVNLHRLAEAHADTSLHREAAEVFARVLEEIPTDTEARYNRALALFRLGERDEAEDEVRRVLAGDPWNAPAYHLFARLRLAVGDEGGATAGVMAYRGLADGARVARPASYLDVSATAGREGRKRWVLDRPPDRIQSYVERGGATVEVWFWRHPTRVVGLSEGRLVAEARPGEGADVHP